MPIVIVLVLLWVGTLLDMVSTYVMVVILSDEFREINQNLIASNGDFLLVKLLVINGVFLFVFSFATVFAMRNRNMVKKYIRETGLCAHAKVEWSSMKEPIRVDLVSRRVHSSVSTIVVVGSAGGARFLAFVNNLTEYYGYPGFMSIFLWAFPGIPNQLALLIVFVIAVFALYPITYMLLRLTAK